MKKECYRNEKGHVLVALITYLTILEVNFF